MKTSAIISDCGRYRYHLRREWAGLTEQGAPLPHVLFVMLNPSTADAVDDDPTITKCIGFASRLGYFALEVVNLWAFRTTYPTELKAAWWSGIDIVGEENNAHIRFAAGEAERVIVAWGAFTGCNIAARAADVREVLERAGKAPSCLGRLKDGAPWHPLMRTYAAPMEAWP